MTTTVEANKELVRRVNDGLNDQSESAFADHHATDLVLHDAGEEIHGIDAALARERAIWNAFPDLHHTIEAIVCEGETVAYRFTATGTHDGDFRGIEPTGREVTITGHGTVRIEGDELAEVWLDYDRLGMLQQLGVVDPGPA